MSVGFPAESLVHYVDGHTGCTESSWDEADPAQRGLFPFAAINGPKVDEFLGLIRAPGGATPRATRSTGKRMTSAR